MPRVGGRPREAVADGPGLSWTLDMSDPKLALMRMPTWVTYNSRWDWKGWLQGAFESLERSNKQALVIDLRSNEGGTDVGDALLAHLIDTELVLNRVLRLVRYRRVPEDLEPYLDTWDPSFKDWGDGVKPFNQRFLRLTRYDDGDAGIRISPAKPRFLGRVFVLIGATNSSATFSFAERVRQAGVATLVRQPTGGNLRGINGGAFFFVRLSRSRIELDLPLIGQFPVGETPADRGVAPDILVERTAEDLGTGADPELRAVRHAMGLEGARA